MKTQTTNNQWFKEGQEAFSDAIKAGFLNEKPESAKYAGAFMYMHSRGSIDVFKHIDTRQYICFDREQNIVMAGAL